MNKLSTAFSSFARLSVVLIASLTFASIAYAQSQQCAPTSPVAFYTTAPTTLVIDLGTCVSFQGTSSAYALDAAYDVPVGDLPFGSSPLVLTLDYSTPDTYTATFTVYVSDSLGAPVTTTVTFSPVGSGQYVASLPITYAPGMHVHIAEHLDVEDSVAQCFAWGYYCYFTARFTVHN